MLIELGDYGLSNKPRTGPEKRGPQDCEAYCFRRWLIWMTNSGQITFPLTVIHRERPDFEVIEGGETYFLEFTEACPVEDGREMAVLEKELRNNPNHPPELIGSRGGSGHGGYCGNQAEDEVIQEINLRIHEKSSKGYAQKGNTDLLIYPNGNARLVMTRDECFEYVEARLPRQHNFRRLFIYWDAMRIKEIQQ